MLNWTQIGVELARLILFLALAYLLSSFTLGELLRKQGPELAKEVLRMDEKQVASLKGPRQRVEKTAKAMIAEDLMTNTPLAQFMGALREETRDYLKAHPEALPEVLQSYAGTVDLALKLSPELLKLAEGFLGKRTPGDKYDY